MSSIFGKFQLNGQLSDKEDLLSMEKALNHWSADQSNIWQNEQIALGHLMLYNTPESLYEKLPFFCSESQLAITADARIDNRDELIQKLDIRAKKEELTDSVIILRSYEKYGNDCVKHLIGDFAFAIWDAQEQKLFCARDHMGVKPFFYYLDDNFFAFASEKKGLLAIQTLNKQEDENYLLKIAIPVWPEPEETLYKNIKRLTAAYSLLVVNRKITLNKYWDLDEKKQIQHATSQDYAEHFLELFKESIKCRLRSVYTIGTELSGGLDSSGITCIASDLLHAQNRTISSFTYGLPPETEHLISTEKREEHFADSIIRFAHIDYPVKIYSSGYAHFLEETDLNLFVNDGPYNRNTWHLPVKKKAGEEKVRTLLSGFPGDELVTANNKMYLLELARWRSIGEYFTTASAELNGIGALKLLLHTWGGDFLHSLLKGYKKSKQIQIALRNEKNYVAPQYQEHIIPLIKDVEKISGRFRGDEKRKILAAHVSERLEIEDRTGLMYKVETRFPMADIRLMEYVLSVPYQEKMQRGKGRLLYRNSMAGILPDSILARTDKTVLLQPFMMKELFERQEPVKKWLLQLKGKGQIPGFINFNKLISEYAYNENADSLLTNMLVRKRVENILRWKTKY